MITYRALQAHELTEATGIFVESGLDLLERSGLPRQPFTIESRLPAYRHIKETGIFEVAVEDGCLIGIANGFVRENTFFLSGFWLRPGHQGKGAGKPLFTRVMERGRALGADRFFVWASVDLAAIATYMKAGMLPLTQVFTFTGWPGELQSRELAQVETSPLSPDFADEVDANILGYRRRVDHGFWDVAGGVAKAVSVRGKPVGYFRVLKGVVGPVAWLASAGAEQVFLAALKEAMSEQAGAAKPEIRIPVPGSNHFALESLLGQGMKLVGTGHVLASSEYSLPLQRYIPSGPLLF